MYNKKMLPKTQRISKTFEIEKVLKKGQKTGGGLVTLLTLPNRFSFSRFGVLVSSKQFKKASQRNRIKRLVFGVLKEKRSQIRPGLDLLVKIKKEARFDEFKKDIEECLKMVRPSSL